MDRRLVVRALVIDPDDGRRERLVRSLESRAVAVVAVPDLGGVEVAELAEPAQLVFVSSTLFPEKDAPGEVLALPEPVVRVAVVDEGERSVARFLTGDFHAVLRSPVSVAEVDRVVAFAEALLGQEGEAERRRLHQLEAWRLIQAEVLTLAGETSDWLDRSLQLAQRLLQVSALAVWEFEIDANRNRLSCRSALGLVPEYVLEAERAAEGRGRAIIEALLDSPLQPIELRPGSRDPRVTTADEVRGQLGLAQAVVIPVREDGSVRGMVSFYFDETMPFDPDDLPVYDAVAATLATGLAIARAHRRLLFNQRMLHELVDELAIGVVVCGLDGTVVLANQVAARLLTGEDRPLDGQPLPRLFRGRTTLPWEDWRRLPPGAIADPLVVKILGPDRRLRTLDVRARSIDLPDERTGGWTQYVQLLLQDITLEWRRLVELELLHDLTRMVTERRDLEAAFTMVAKRLQREFEYVLVGLAMVSPDRQRFIGQAISVEETVSFNEWLVSRGITGRAVRENRSQLVVDVHADPDYLAPISGAGVESEVVVVLRRWGEPVGVLNIESRTGHRLDAEDLRLAENIGAHLELLMEQVELTDRLARQALTDPLTGLANRRALIDRLQQVTRDRRIDHAAVLLIDFDNFKRLNDQRGHLFGDVVLQQVANRLAQSIRPDDLLARYAGDEFAVVLTDVDRQHAYEVAERLRRAVANAPVVHGGLSVNLTISIGVALYPEHGRTPDELIRVADEMMYLAKGRGGNAVVLPTDGA